MFGSDYVRLSGHNGAESPQGPGHHMPFASSVGAPGPQYAIYNDSDDEMIPSTYQQQESLTIWDRLRGRGHRPAVPPPQSGYLTLIPLSDSRLKPQNTSLIVGCLLTLAIASVCGVFFLVPRGVTVGSIQVHSSQISFNTSKSTYQILLTATIPVYNPNYLRVRVSGSINVSFYDQQAGYTLVEPVEVPARAQPQVISVEMDASSVPQKYLFTIYTQCFTFPEKLIFFLTGNLQAEYLGKMFHLPNIDNYFIINCNQSGPEADKTRQQLLAVPGTAAITDPALPGLGQGPEGREAKEAV